MMFPKKNIALSVWAKRAIVISRLGVTCGLTAWGQVIST
jgi:hypothetical protein